MGLDVYLRVRTATMVPRATLDQWKADGIPAGLPPTPLTDSHMEVAVTEDIASWRNEHSFYERVLDAVGAQDAESGDTVELDHRTLTHLIDLFAGPTGAPLPSHRGVEPAEFAAHVVRALGTALALLDEADELNETSAYYIDREVSLYASY